MNIIYNFLILFLFYTEVQVIMRSHGREVNVHINEIPNNKSELLIIMSTPGIYKDFSGRYPTGRSFHLKEIVEKWLNAQRIRQWRQPVLFIRGDR